MKTQIKHTADGTPYTEIQKPFDAEWVKEQLKMGMPVVAVSKRNENLYLYEIAPSKMTHAGKIIDSFYAASFGMPRYEDDFNYTIANLPALPKHPENTDINLILQYWANGLIPHGDFKMLRVFYDEERNLLPKSLWKYKVFKDLMVAVNPFEIGRYVDLYAEIESLEAEGEKITITHCEDSQGNKHEVAIIED
jgi:hypothetical protein